MSLTPALFPAAAASSIAPLLTPPQPVIAQCGNYRARLASTDADREAVYRLRFLVFNLELHEGLESAYTDGLDTDLFDNVCEHLLVEDATTGMVVGTYRLQTGDNAARNLGYYSEQEFDFAPYEHMRGELMELGRACVHRDYRNSDVLHLLWKGLVRYARQCGSRYLIGCSSLSSQVPADGRAVYRELMTYTVDSALITLPTTECTLPAGEPAAECAEPPRLLRAYLALGARICGPPAIDYSFGTIDFLTLVDLEALHPRVLRRFL